MTQLIKVSGDNQSGENGTLLPNALVVRAADQFGNAINGASVTFTVFSGGSGATVNPPTAQTTPANGQVQVTAALGTALGTYIYRATSGNFIADFTATAVPSVATVLLQVGVTNTAEVFTSQTFTVQANDVRGNPVAGVTITFAATSGGAGVGVNPALVLTDANGRASTTITLGQLAGTNRFTATASGILAPNVAVLTVDVVGTPAAAFALNTVSGNNQTSTVSTPLPQPLIVEVRDQFNNLKPGVPVTFTVTSGGGLGAMVNPTGAQNTDANGQVQVTATLGSGPVNYTFTASSPNLVSQIFTATGVFVAGSITQISGNGQIVNPDLDLITPLTVRVTTGPNGTGTPIPGAPVTWSVTTGGGKVNGSTTPVVTFTNSNGDASVIGTVGSATGANTFTASVQGASGPLTTVFSATSSTAISANPITVDVIIDSPTVAIGSYQTTITFDNRYFKVTSSSDVTGGTAAGFTTPPQVINIQNAGVCTGPGCGELGLANFQFSSSPIGNGLIVARVTFTAIRSVPGPTALLLSTDPQKPTAVTDTGANDIIPPPLRLSTATLATIP